MPSDSNDIEAESLANTQPKGTGKARLKTLEDLDKRTRARKRAEERRQSVIEDLGADSLTKADHIRIGQAVLLDALIEDMSARARLVTLVAALCSVLRHGRVA
jgi:hypothetical protein